MAPSRLCTVYLIALSSTVSLTSLISFLCLFVYFLLYSICVLCFHPVALVLCHCHIFTTEHLCMCDVCASTCPQVLNLIDLCTPHHPMLVLSLRHFCILTLVFICARVNFVPPPACRCFSFSLCVFSQPHSLSAYTHSTPLSASSHSLSAYILTHTECLHPHPHSQ